jgi:hypothetical protein
VTLQRVSPAASGLTLSGTYDYTNYVDTSGAAGAGSVSSEHSISFDAAGHFHSTDFAGQTGATDATSTSAEGAGSYQLDGYTVILTFNDGSSHAYSFFSYPGNGGNLIDIDGALYLRQ